jgi:hypothetical protein
MITSLFLYIFGYIIGFFAMLLPNWTIWPQDLTDGISYFASKIADFNIIVPIINWFLAAHLFLQFLVYFMIYKSLVGLVNWVRGSGSISS